MAEPRRFFREEMKIVVKPEIKAMALLSGNPSAFFEESAEVCSAIAAVLKGPDKIPKWLKDEMVMELVKVWEKARGGKT